MKENALHIIILAAGKGTRMKSETSKICHAIGGRPLLEYVLETAQHLNPAQVTCVLSPKTPEVHELLEKQDIPNLQIAIQKTQEGTGHAVMAARKQITAQHPHDLLIIYGDTPLLTVTTLKKLIDKRENQKSSVTSPAIVVLGMRPKNPGRYGRLITTLSGDVEAIVEYNDATPIQRDIDLCNSGVMLINGHHALDFLDQLSNDNSQKEYLLTDLVKIARNQDLPVHYVEGNEEELLGINGRQDQARAEQALQERWRTRAMENGVTLLDPESVYFSYDTEVGRDIVIQPNVFLGPNVKIEDKVTIRSNCYLEGAYLCKGATIGPFAHIRPGTTIGAQARIGNFVEIKASHIDDGAKVNHLSYIGDSDIGSKANIGAGTITCNYDGFSKQRTIVGKQAFIGSNTCLIAPVEIGDKSIIGAGSVITHEVSPDALAYSRAPQQEIADGAVRYRRKRIKLKIVSK